MVLKKMAFTVLLASTSLACSRTNESPVTIAQNPMDAAPPSDAPREPRAEDKQGKRRREELYKIVQDRRAGWDVAMVAALDDPSAFVRDTAVNLVADTNHPAAMTVLARMSTDEHVIVRLAVVEALSLRLGTPAAMDQLLEWGPADPDAFIRYATATKFADRKDRRIVPFLERELKRPDSPDFPRREIELMLRELGAE